MSQTAPLFPDRYGVYNYCPSPVMISEQEMYIFFCANSIPGLVIDDIYARHGMLKNGSWQFEEPFVALTPSRLGWDCIHVCDPEVVKGNFAYKGEHYSWVMLYLGCDIHFCYHNQIGVAVAKEIGGPYIKCDCNPLVGYDEMFHWGVGQAAAVSLDQKGLLRVIYSKTIHEYSTKKLGNATFWRDIDLADLEHPVFGEEVMVCTDGIVNLDGSTDTVMVNPTFGWDRASDRYFLTREGTPFEQEDVPNFIAPYTQVLSIVRADFECNQGGWQLVKNITAEDTGYRRNHNAGLFKDSYGYLPVGKPLVVGTTVSELHRPDFLWTYRIHGVTVPLVEEA